MALRCEECGKEDGLIIYANDMHYCALCWIREFKPSSREYEIEALARELLIHNPMVKFEDTLRVSKSFYAAVDKWRAERREKERKYE